jgi:cell division initiation protein
MRITPLDIIQKQFAPGRRGYDSDEVRAFLEEVRESMEELLRENQRLRTALAEREAQIEELRSTESDVKATLMLARKLSDDLERTARREADVVVGEARLEAERILMATADERRDLQVELVQLRAQRARLLTDLRAVVDAHGMMLDEHLRADGPAIVRSEA